METADSIPEALVAFLSRGGPALWAIAVLSVVALAVTLWKIWTLSRPLGANAGRRALASLRTGDRQAAFATLDGRRDMAGVLREAMAKDDGDLAARRASVEVRARAWLADLASGSRVLELTVVIAPLLGLLGTVLGMIEAFRTLEAAGSRADPALLAGGIWEALLTTAAGMAVAIPASVALSWVEARVDRAARDLESLLTDLHLIQSRR